MADDTVKTAVVFDGVTPGNAADKEFADRLKAFLGGGDVLTGGKITINIEDALAAHHRDGGGAYYNITVDDGRHSPYTLRISEAHMKQWEREHTLTQSMAGSEPKKPNITFGNDTYPNNTKPLDLGREDFKNELRSYLAHQFPNAKEVVVPDIQAASAEKNKKGEDARYSVTVDGKDTSISQKNMTRYAIGLHAGPALVDGPPPQTQAPFAPIKLNMDLNEPTNPKTGDPGQDMKPLNGTHFNPGEKITELPLQQQVDKNKILMAAQGEANNLMDYVKGQYPGQNPLDVLAKTNLGKVAASLEDDGKLTFRGLASTLLAMSVTPTADGGYTFNDKKTPFTISSAKPGESMDATIAELFHNARPDAAKGIMNDIRQQYKDFDSAGHELRTQKFGENGNVLHTRLADATRGIAPGMVQQQDEQPGKGTPDLPDVASLVRDGRDAASIDRPAAAAKVAANDRGIGGVAV